MIIIFLGSANEWEIKGKFKNSFGQKVIPRRNDQKKTNNNRKEKFLGSLPYSPKSCCHQKIWVVKNIFRPVWILFFKSSALSLFRNKKFICNFINPRKKSFNFLPYFWHTKTECSILFFIWCNINFLPNEMLWSYVDNSLREK